MTNSSDSRLMAFMFTDVVGSVAMKTRLGDTAYIRLLERHNAIFKAVVSSIPDADTIKSTGDGFLARFPSASAAVGAALRFQWALAHEPWGDTPLRVRVGMHVGEAVDVQGIHGEPDVAGLAVDMAARIMGLAMPGQILLTRAALDAARPFVREHPPVEPPTTMGRPTLHWVTHPRYVFQGKREPLEVFEVGAEGVAPLTAPPDSEKAHRYSPAVVALPHNLPRYLSSFVGRTQELADVKQLLRETRLLTLTGAGGCGKTRLSLRVAGELLADYPDGAWFVELAALSDPDRVPQQVRSVLRLTEQPGKPVTQILIEHLQDKHVLVILDNCEHLIDACASLVDELLHACPRMQLMATSQERLGIAGETTYRVPSLSLPAESTTRAADLAESEAVSLFVERARAAKPNFTLTDANAPAVAAICRRVDGIPLAIELAGACIRAITIDQIAGRLDEMFRILTRGDRTELKRHQTLRATIDWSYQLLSPQAKRLLARLSVFVGGWTLEAAEKVCSDDPAAHDSAPIADADVVSLLMSLVDRSLVMHEETSGDQGRYRLLESVRQFARENLKAAGEGDAVRDRHLDYYLARTKAAEPELLGANQKQWLDQLEADHNNLLAALRWCGSNRDSGSYATKAHGIAGSLWCFWDLHGHYVVGRAELEAAAKMASDQPTDALAKVFNAAGYLAFRQGDNDAAFPLSQRSFQIREQLGDRAGVGRALHNLGNIAHARGDYVTAQSMFRQALAIHRQVGARAWEAGILANLGEMEVRRNDFASARALSVEALKISREVNNRAWIALSVKNLGDVASQRGNYDLAQVLYAECLEIRRELVDRRGIADLLEAVSHLANAQDEPSFAARLLGAAERLRAEIASPLRTSERVRYDAIVADLRVALEPAAFDRAWAEGRDQAWQAAVGEALAWLRNL